jgi:UDP:flavonoid glycosyltransferase YjiC (YdhE family)
MRIILTTFGSLGDLHPYLAISSALKDRGHQPVIATSLFYKDKVEKAGIGFHAIRPDFPDAKTAAALMVRVMDHRKGSEVVVRELVMPHLRDSYDDLLEAVRGGKDRHSLGLHDTCSHVLLVGV